MGKVLCEGILLPRRAANNLALPDGAPSKVASRASARWLAAFGAVLNGRMPGLIPPLLATSLWQTPWGYGSMAAKGVEHT